MLFLPLIWLCLFALLAGCGALAANLLLRALRRPMRAGLDLFQLAWLGYALVIATLQLLSLVLPLDGRALALIAALSLAGYALSVRLFVKRLRRVMFDPARRGRVLALTLGAALLALVIAYCAAGPVLWYDTSLYHLQAVRWAARFPAVSGLVQLHSRLAYNSSFHLFGALTETLWTHGAASHLALGFLLALLLAQWLFAIASRRRAAPAQLARAFALITLAFLCGKLWTSEIASLSTDLAVAALCLAAVFELWQIGSLRRCNELHLLLALALSAVALTTKLGALPIFAAAAIAACCVFAVRRDRRRQISIALILPALLLLGSSARSAVLSGWLWFPIPVGNLHLAWSYPAEHTLLELRWVQSWARLPRHSPEDVLDHGLLHWFVPWWATFQQSRALILLCVSLLILVVRLAIPRCRSRFTLAEGAALFAALGSLAFWFQGAPDLRFGSVFFWLLLGVATAPLLARWSSDRRGRLAGLAIALALTAWNNGLAPYFFARDPTALPAFETFPIERRTLPSGLELLVPTEGDQCGDAELPCTPTPRDQRLRTRGDLGSGFEATKSD